MSVTSYANSSSICTLFVFVYSAALIDSTQSLTLKRVSLAVACACSTAQITYYTVKRFNEDSFLPTDPSVSH